MLYFCAIVHISVHSFKMNNVIPMRLFQFHNNMGSVAVTKNITLVGESAKKRYT